jgi:hypothetical protein
MHCFENALKAIVSGVVGMPARIAGAKFQVVSDCLPMEGIAAGSGSDLGEWHVAGIAFNKDEYLEHG